MQASFSLNVSFPSEFAALIPSMEAGGGPQEISRPVDFIRL
jgi:hypothetical protein